MKITHTEIWVNRTNYHNTRSVELPQPQLAEGEIYVAIDKFALTANNVTYAVSGDMIGYWNYFPTNEEDWGKVTVWGMGDVIESKHPDIAVGERIYGFFPMASHLVMLPGGVKEQSFFDDYEHRRQLPALYNRYNRCQAEPEMMHELEDMRCILFPLYMTGYIIADFLYSNDYFDAEQIIISSVSSKTGYSLAAFLRENNYSGRIIGLTSPSNVDFVKSLTFCDQVVTYDYANSVANLPSVYVDMSGDKSVLSALHHHLGDNMKSSQIVGATHWKSFNEKVVLPGARPTLFFAPAQIDKRNKEWGPQVLTEKGFTATVRLSSKLKQLIETEYHQGVEAIEMLWRALLDNAVSGKRGIMASLKEGY